jgi:hypothetical protein
LRFSAHRDRKHKGFKTRLHFYTVPGQVYYNSTRRAVLTGVDGVVFVADSQRDKMEENLESLNNLEENLNYYGKSIKTLPLVFQYNKRDLPDVETVTELEQVLNPYGYPFFEAVATTGEGVLQTLTRITKMVLQHIEMGTSGRQPKPAASPAPPSFRPQAPPPEPAPARPAPQPRPTVTSHMQDLGVMDELEQVRTPPPRPHEMTFDTEPVTGFGQRWNGQTHAHPGERGIRARGRDAALRAPAEPGQAASTLGRLR